MKQKPYGEAAERHARNLLSQGWTAEQVKAVEVCEKIPSGTLRSWKKRMQRQDTIETKSVAKKEGKNKSVATLATPENSLQRENETPQQGEKTALHTLKTLFVPKIDSEYEVAYFTAVAISCIGIVAALHWVGAAVALVHYLVAKAALNRCKRGGATLDDLGAVVFSGLFVGVPSDIVWANEAVWANVQNLPLKLEPTFSGQMWIGRDVDMPFSIACYIAAFLWVSTCSTAWLTQNEAKAKK